jgi:hypothetical protein
MLGLYDTGTFVITGAGSSGRKTSTIAYTAYKEPWWYSTPQKTSSPFRARQHILEVSFLSFIDKISEHVCTTYFSTNAATVSNRRSCPTLDAPSVDRSQRKLKLELAQNSPNITKFTIHQCDKDRNDAFQTNCYL